MRTMSNIIQIFLVFILFYGCSDLLDDYETNSISALTIDKDICIILNEKESISASIFSKNDTVSNEDLFYQYANDTNLFISLSNNYAWSIDIDSTSYFMVYAPQQADSYFVALNSSSQFELYNSEGNIVSPENKNISTKNIAGCPSTRVRHVYVGLNGVYLGRLFNPNVSNVELVIMNTNQAPVADFSTNIVSTTIGDTITFVDKSLSGTYPIKSYTWDFGDNNSSNTTTSVMHAYGDSGVFSPSLMVSDGYLLHTITKNDLITINNLDNQ